MNNLSAVSHDQAQALAQNLRKLLNVRAVSENEIAQSLKIPVMTIRRICSGETSDPRISTVKLIAEYFNVSIDALLENHSNSSPPFMAKKMPQFIPILDWKTAGTISSIKDLNLNSLKEWHPIVLNDNATLSEQSFALESRPSMQPRFPSGTLFIIDPNENPNDGDMILIKMKTDGNLSLRHLIIDSPKWQLQPIVAGSEIFFYEENKHTIMGIVVLTMLHTRK